MLQVLFFYIFIWWFKKLENKKTIIIRAVLAGILGVYFWIGSFVLISLIMIEKVLIVLVITDFTIAILFTIRLIKDIKQIRLLSIDFENQKSTSLNTENEPNDYVNNG